MPFNNSLRRFILAQGSDGEVLLKLLDEVEARGANQYDNIMLQVLISKCPMAAELDTAIKAALLNWTIGVANNMIKYSVHNGFDAWRKLYHRYVPLVEDSQNILIQELMCLKPVGEGEIDAVFNVIERITDFYVKTGPTDNLSERWIRAAIMKNLPEKIVTSPSIELRTTETVDEIQHIINTYMHDHRAGLPRGIPGPMACLAQKEGPDTPEEEDNKTHAHAAASTVEPTTTAADSIINASKGNKKGDYGQREGYGQCWERGEMGHPRCECPVFFKRMGRGTEQDNTMAALEGTGKYWKGGKWAKGKYKGGKGKGFNGGKNTKGYRAFGKAIGKGFNYWGEDDYAAAWGR